MKPKKPVSEATHDELNEIGARAGRNAIRNLHAKGIPAVFSEGGQLWKLMPDGTREIFISKHVLKGR